MEFDKNGILNRAKAAQQTAAVMDEGLRAYMLKVYNYMATGILPVSYTHLTLPTKLTV